MAYAGGPCGWSTIRKAVERTLSVSGKPAATQLAQLQVEQAGVATERKQADAALGPVRYLATLIGAGDEQVMRWSILAVALLLDPRRSVAVGGKSAIVGSPMMTPAEEISRLRGVARRALAVADERSKENVELRAAIERLSAALIAAGIDPAVIERIRARELYDEA